MRQTSGWGEGFDVNVVSGIAIDAEGSQLGAAGMGKEVDMTENASVSSVGFEARMDGWVSPPSAIEIKSPMS